MNSPLNDIVGQAAIVCIGDELLIGQVINTNASSIAQRVNGVGIMVQKVFTIGDDEQQILETFRESLEVFGVVLVTGGLGPTHDDLTRAAACKFFNTDLVLDKSVLENIRSLMQKRNLPWTAAAEDQAMVPRSCTVIPNKQGTAPGMLFNRDGKYLIIMPGVPYEMESMMDDFVVPYFRQKTTGKVIRHRTLKTAGIPESFLAEKLSNIDELLNTGQGSSGQAKLAFLPTPLGVKLRITVVDSDTTRAERNLAEIEQRIRKRIEKYIYGTDDEELEEIVGRLLTEQKLTLAVAESCTGGLIANRITNVPGSSNYFERGVVAYSNRAKTEILGVPEPLLGQFGAVSREAAEAMASGIRRSAKTHIGISTTGIAGPAGGTSEKPVGLVWVGYSDEKETLALKFHFGDNRLRFKERASQAALELVRRKLLKIQLQRQGEY